MKEVLASWSTAHEQLLRGDARAPGAGGLSEAVRDGLLGLEAEFREDAGRGEEIIQIAETDRPDSGTVRDGLAVILDNEAEYLRRMDSVVGSFETEARGRALGLNRISWGVTGLTLASLAAIVLFVLRPAVGLIRRPGFGTGAGA